jgi:hypothetical protein
VPRSSAYTCTRKPIQAFRSMRKLRLGFGSIALNGIVVPDARIMYHINNQKDPQYSVFHGSYKVQTRRYFIPYSSSNQADK